MMTKTIRKLVTAYDKAVADFEKLDCSEIDVRYTWAQNRVFARAEDVAQALSRHLKHEERLSKPPAQCDYVKRNGTDGYLCCRYKPGHKVPHRDGYLEDHSEPEDWMPRTVWEEKYAAAAAACYAVPGRKFQPKLADCTCNFEHGYHAVSCLKVPDLGRMR